MVHTGNAFSLNTRDQIVGQAQTSDTLVARDSGQNLKAAFLDFGGNLLIGAVPTTITGWAVIGPYPIAAYRGWVGGIVSVDGEHHSRLANPGQAVYYLVTLILQLIPYALSGGAGVNVGLSVFRTPPYYQGEKWFGFSKEAILDMLRIYALVVPLFLIASLWEFLA